jgi:hypothetical protein
VGPDGAEQTPDPDPAVAPIAVYVVTYRKPEVLAANLRSLYAGMAGPDRVRVTVLSNHPDVEIPADVPAPRVVINSTRSPNAWGYLARDWNWALMDGFGTWRGSDIGWCVLAQNDVEWLPDWESRLRAVRGIDFFSQPRGDQAMAFTIRAVREVGLFDERFCTLHFQEQDYFARAMLVLGERASLTDDHEHHEDTSSWNPLGQVLIAPSWSGFDDEDERFHTRKTHDELARLLANKWGVDHQDAIFDKRTLRVRHEAGLVQIPTGPELYPYFWDDSPDERWTDPAYAAPTVRSFDVSYLVIGGGDAARLLQRLHELAEVVGDNDEVLIHCHANPATLEVRAMLQGNVAVTYEPVANNAEVADLLARLARGRVHRVIDVTE